MTCASQNMTLLEQKWVLNYLKNLWSASLSKLTCIVQAIYVSLSFPVQLQIIERTNRRWMLRNAGDRHIGLVASAIETKMIRSSRLMAQGGSDRMIQAPRYISSLFRNFIIIVPMRSWMGEPVAVGCSKETQIAAFFTVSGSSSFSDTWSRRLHYPLLLTMFAVWS